MVRKHTLICLSLIDIAVILLALVIKASTAKNVTTDLVISFERIANPNGVWYSTRGVRWARKYCRALGDQAWPAYVNES